MIIIIIFMKTYRAPLTVAHRIIQYNVSQLQRKTNSNMLKTIESYD